MTKTTTPLPEISSYYGNGNYGTHAMVVSVGMLDIYYSYKTPVAFRTPETGLIVRVNDWGPTTGKHLNAIDGGEPDRKKARISGDDFEARLRLILESYGLHKV